jgi:hypothetical protein
LTIRERLGDRYGLAQVWTNIGILYLQTGRGEEAKPLLAAAFRVFARLGSPHVNEAASWLVQACGSEDEANTYLLEQQLLGYLAQVHREDVELREQLWQLTQRIVGNASLPIKLRALGRVVTHILAGEHEPDLAGLSPEVAGAVREMLEELKNE